MTTKEIADIAGVSVDTVQKKIKEMFPEIVEQRKKTVLNKMQAIEVMKDLRKKNFILPQNSADLPQNSADSRLDLALSCKVESAVTELEKEQTKML